MSRTDINFTDYKASGVYFVERDNSIIESVDAVSGRLAIGFSKKGPFNAPVYIDNSSDLGDVFGGPDQKLERKGVFFNRSLQTLISVAPVYALNLLPFDEDVKDPSTTINNVGSVVLGAKPSDKAQTETKLKYQNLHDTSRFWRPSDERLQENLQESLISFANVGTSDFTLIVRKAEGLTGYNSTVRDWYGTPDAIPYKFMQPSDSMLDYFIQVICLEGDWTDSKLATDVFWKEYFELQDGEARLKKSKVTKFLGLDQVNVIGNYTGCILPDFYDKSNILRSIKDIVNSATKRTGLLMSVNVDIMENTADYTTPYTIIDFVGHSVVAEDVPVCEFMSYDFAYDVSSMKHTIEDTSVCAINGTEIVFYSDSSILPSLTVGTMVGTEAGLTKITKKRKYPEDSSIVCVLTVADEDKIKGLSDGDDLYIVPSISDTYTNLRPLLVKGLDIDMKISELFNIEGDNGIFMDNEGNSYVGEDAPIARIYNVLNDKGIRRGLLNRQLIDYRYIIDTMAHGLGTELGSKKFLSRLAKDHERTTAFLNAPSVTEFSKCQYSAFYDADDPYRTFDAKYVQSGGNDELIKSIDFTLPSEENGAKYCGVFSPFLKYKDGQKDIYFPPAAEVANRFMSKYSGGDPYATIANTDGILSGGKIVGLEYEYDDIDRGYLEPFGINPIIQLDKNVCVYGDRTAFQNYLTDYNYLHVRELLNTIEIECNAVLQKYVFKKNNPATRSEVYKKINPILSSMQESGALYKYELQIDEDNNTNEVIDNSFAIIDIGVWITKNMEKVVARITLNKLSQD